MPPDAALRYISQKLPHAIELVITREDLDPRLFCRRSASFRIFALGLELNDLRVLLEDVRQTCGRQNLFPQVIRLQSRGIRRIPGAVVPAFVERQKPGSFSAQMRAHAYFRIIDCEMNDAASELEQLLARVTVAPVLFDTILDRLLRKAVLKLERCDLEPVDKQAKIERALRLVHAVA